MNSNPDKGMTVELMLLWNLEERKEWMKKVLQIERKQECWSFVPGVAYTRVPSWYDSSVKNLRMSILMPKHREDRKNLPVLVWLCGGAFQVMDPDVWIPQWTEFAAGAVS